MHLLRSIRETIASTTAFVKISRQRRENGRSRLGEMRNIKKLFQIYIKRHWSDFLHRKIPAVLHLALYPASQEKGKSAA